MAMQPAHTGFTPRPGERMNMTRLRPRQSVLRSLTMVCVSVFALLPAAPADANAQEAEGVYRISQRGTVSQTLGNAVISLDYSRPLVRGRSDLFGKVVHWGELWTPGANEATVLEVSEEVKLNGHAIPEGRWSMWIIPSQVGPWELVLDARDTLFHTERPELTDDQIRFVVDVQERSHIEALTWEFQGITHNGARMQMGWGTVQIPIEVEVEPILPVLAMTADVAARYVGEWQVTFTPDPESGRGPPPTVFTVRQADDGALYGAFPPGAFGPPPPEAEPTSDESDMTPQERERAEARRALATMESGAFEYVLVPRAEGVFLFGYVDDGELLEVEKVYHEFEFEDGHAVRLTVRSAEDTTFMTATRVVK